MAGLDEKELKALAALDTADLPHRERVALSWVHSFMENGGEVPEELDREFRSVLSPQERACVLAAHKAMFVSNLTANTLLGFLDRMWGRGVEGDQAPACRVSL